MRTALRWGFLVIAAGLLVWAVATRWDEVADSLRALTPAALIGALAACIAALGLNAMSWRAVMGAVGLSVGPREAARVFLLSQIGKYVPGSVWPVVAQAELARDHGVSRARAVSGSIVAMVVGVVTAAFAAAAAVASANAAALADYWWVLPVCAVLGTMLVPPVLSRIVALAFRVARQTEEPARIGARPLLVAIAWSLGMWTLLGVHAWVLLREIAPSVGPLAATGAFAFSWLIGFLVVVAPAGAGAREAALVVALGALATPAQALTFALVSRFVMTVADVVGLGVGVSLRRRPPLDRRSG